MHNSILTFDSNQAQTTQPRFRLGRNSAAHLSAVNRKLEQFILIECNHATETMETIGTFHTLDDAIESYSQAAWEADGLGGLRLQVICNRRVIANARYIDLPGEPAPVLTWVLVSGEVRKFAKRSTEAGDYLAQQVA